MTTARSKRIVGAMVDVDTAAYSEWLDGIRKDARAQALDELQARAEQMARNSGILQYGPVEFLQAIEDVRAGHTMAENRQRLTEVTP